MDTKDIVFEAIKDLQGVKYFYKSYCSSAIASVCHKKGISLTKQEKDNAEKLMIETMKRFSASNSGDKKEGKMGAWKRFMELIGFIGFVFCLFIVVFLALGGDDWIKQRHNITEKGTNMNGKNRE